MKERLFQRIGAWLGVWWGLTILCAFSLLSLLRLELQQSPLHYRVFTGAGHALLNGGNPYGDTFGTGVGYYFYSPACAMLIFGPLSFLPEGLGMAVYMSVSFAAFFWGAREFWRAFGGSERGLQWFWALITSQVVLAILASKVELLIAGLLLGSLALLRDAAKAAVFRPNPRSWNGLLLLSMILNWKIQPIPVVGLFLLSWILIRREWRLPLLFCGCLAFWYALPFAFFKASYLVMIYSTLQSTLGHFMAEAFLDFENVFAFLNKGFGVPVSLLGSQVVSGLFALVLAAYVALWIRRAPLERRYENAILLSAGLGGMYMAAFSPLGQNNALILYSPLLLVTLAWLDRPGSHAALRWLCFGACAVMILAYSDLVPSAVREEFRHLSIKAVACLVLGLGLLWESWKSSEESLGRSAGLG